MAQHKIRTSINRLHNIHVRRLHRAQRLRCPRRHRRPHHIVHRRKRPKRNVRRQPNHPTIKIHPPPHVLAVLRTRRPHPPRHAVIRSRPPHAPLHILRRNIHRIVKTQHLRTRRRIHHKPTRRHHPSPHRQPRRLRRPNPITRNKQKSRHQPQPQFQILFHRCNFINLSSFVRNPRPPQCLFCPMSVYHQPTPTSTPICNTIHLHPAALTRNSFKLPALKTLP